MDRGGTQARPLPAEPVSPGRLPPDEPRRCGSRSAGTTLVDTSDTIIVFETALAPRALRRPVACAHRPVAALDTSSYCNYKGYATYWSAVIGDTVVEDVAWSYDDPLPETLPIKGYFSFDASRADVVAELPGV